MRLLLCRIGGFFCLILKKVLSLQSNMKQYQLLILLVFFLLLPDTSMSQGLASQSNERMPWEISDQNKPTDDYHFYTDWRLEVGFQQPEQRSADSTANNTFLNGGKIGFLIDFNLPYHLGIQTGLRYELTYGVNTQHYRSADNNNVSVDYLRHKMLKHSLSIPVRAVYTQQLWRELALTFYTGPTFQIGLAYTDNVLNALSDSTLSWLQNKSPDPLLIKPGKHDYYADGLFRRFNMQWGIGLGLQWQNWRLEGGYNFGLINQCKYQPLTGKKSKMHEWGWEVSVIYTINYHPFDPDYLEKAWLRREERRAAREKKVQEREQQTRWLFGTGFDD